MRLACLGRRERESLGTHHEPISGRPQSHVEGECEQARAPVLNRPLQGSLADGQDKADGTVCEMQTRCWCVGLEGAVLC